MNRRKWTALVAATVVFGLTGCGGDSAGDGASNAAAGAGGTVRIAVIGKSSNNPVFLAARTGAEKAAADITARGDARVQVEWLTPPQEDGQVQAQRIQQAVNEGFDAILLSVSDAGKVTGAINDAVDRGVEVMTFDSDAPDSKRFAYYGVDDIATGEAVMRELATQLNGQGEIAILAGNQNAPNLQARVRGVQQEAAKHAGIKVLGTFYHTETPQDAAAEVARVNNAYPTIQGWAFIGGWPLFTQALLTDIDPAHLKIASVDALPAQLLYVERGVVPVLLAQPVYQWGYVGVETIVDKIVHQRDIPEMIGMDLVRVDSASLGDWARQLRDWGFTDVPANLLDR